MRSITSLMRGNVQYVLIAILGIVFIVSFMYINATDDSDYIKENMIDSDSDIDIDSDIDSDNVEESFRGGRGGRGGRRGGGGRRNHRIGGRRGYGIGRYNYGNRWLGYGVPVATATVATYPYYNRPIPATTSSWYDYTRWYNPWNYFGARCKNGCTNIGNNNWGCQYPGNGREDCIFSSDCYGCG